MIRFSLVVAAMGLSVFAASIAAGVTVRALGGGPGLASVVVFIVFVVLASTGLWIYGRWDARTWREHDARQRDLDGRARRRSAS